MIPVLVIRPQPGADTTAQFFREQGFEAISAPLFAVQPCAWKTASYQDYDALLITSANALRYAGPGLDTLRKLPVLAVGSASAKEAEQRGFTAARTGASGVQDMLDACDPAFRRLLHLAGQDRTEFSAADRMIDTRIVYRSIAVPLDDQILQDIRRPFSVLFHSSRAAAHFATEIDRLGYDRRDINVAAISGTVAEAAGQGWQALVSADAPTDNAMLELLLKLCQHQVQNKIGIADE